MEVAAASEQGLDLGPRKFSGLRLVLGQKAAGHLEFQLGFVPRDRHLIPVCRAGRRQDEVFLGPRLKGIHDERGEAVSVDLQRKDGSPGVASRVISDRVSREVELDDSLTALKIARLDREPDGFIRRRGCGRTS